MQAIESSFWRQGLCGHSQGFSGEGASKSPVAFPVTPKYMILNDLDELFGVKFCFRAGLAG